MPKSVFTDAYATLLERLIALRKRKGVSQVELARRLGREQPFVSRMESGARRIDVIEFCAIARALGYSPQDAFAEVAKALPDDLPI